MALRDSLSSWMDTGGLDGVALVRGASTGFSILVLGGLVAPVAAGATGIGQYWNLAVAVVAFTVAGLRFGGSTSPLLQAPLAAAGAYLLALPVVLMANGQAAEPSLILSTLATAVVIGIVTGCIRQFAGVRARLRNAELKEAP